MPLPSVQAKPNFGWIAALKTCMVNINQFGVLGVLGPLIMVMIDLTIHESLTSIKSLSVSANTSDNDQNDEIDPDCYKGHHMCLMHYKSMLFF